MTIAVIWRMGHVIESRKQKKMKWKEMRRQLINVTETLPWLMSHCCAAHIREKQNKMEKNGCCSEHLSGVTIIASKLKFPFAKNEKWKIKNETEKNSWIFLFLNVLDRIVESIYVAPDVYIEISSIRNSSRFTQSTPNFKRFDKILLLNQYECSNQAIPLAE